MAASDTMRDAYETLSTSLSSSQASYSLPHSLGHILDTEGRFRTSTATTESEASRDKITSVVSPRGEVRAAASSYRKIFTIVSFVSHLSFQSNQDEHQVPAIVDIQRPRDLTWKIHSLKTVRAIVIANTIIDRSNHWTSTCSERSWTNILRRMSRWGNWHVCISVHLCCFYSQSSQPRTRSSTNAQLAKRGSSQLAYNANRYSPKTTVRGPTASVALHARSSKTLARRERRSIYRR